MDETLAAIRVALGQLTEEELAAIASASYAEPQLAPGLLAWIEHAADQEASRRRGIDFPLLEPAAAIDPSEDEFAIAATLALRESFADAPRLSELFKALLDVLTGRGHLQ